MTTINHQEEFCAMLEDYFLPASAYSLDAWTTEDLSRLADLISIELQERAWVASGGKSE